MNTSLLGHKKIKKLPFGRRYHSDCCSDHSLDEIFLKLNSETKFTFRRFLLTPQTAELAKKENDVPF